MAVLPDSDGNGYPQMAVLSERSDGKVKTESRDAQSGGALDGRINCSPKYRPQDVAYVGAVPGFSDGAIASHRPEESQKLCQEPCARPRGRAGVDGKKLFNLNFRFGL